MKTAPKVYVHDQEMAGEGADETSIPLNPAKNRTAGRGGGGQQERGSRKNLRKNKREKVRKVFTYIYPLKPLFVPWEYDFSAYKALIQLYLPPIIFFNFHYGPYLYLGNTISMHIKP